MQATDKEKEGRRIVRVQTSARKIAKVAIRLTFSVRSFLPFPFAFAVVRLLARRE